MATRASKLKRRFRVRESGSGTPPDDPTLAGDSTAGGAGDEIVQALTLINSAIEAADEKRHSASYLADLQKVADILSKYADEPDDDEPEAAQAAQESRLRRLAALGSDSAQLELREIRRQQPVRETPADARRAARIAAMKRGDYRPGM